MIIFNPAPLFQPRVEKNFDPPPRLSTPPLKDKCRPPTSFWTIRTLISCRPHVDVWLMWTHVDRRGAGGQKSDFLVDVINGWPLITTAGLPIVGRDGALVEMMTFNRRVVDSIPALAAT